MQHQWPIIVRLLITAVGIVCVAATIRSALRTVVVPRGERVWLTRLLFGSVRSVYRPIARRHEDHHRRHVVMSRYAPMATVWLAGVWAVGIVSGFALIYFAATSLPFVRAIELSGSSFTTLGFAAPDNDLVVALVVIEAVIGLGIVALIIAYLPTIYSQFATREEMVLQFEVIAGGPPSPEVFLRRAWASDWLRVADPRWMEWERWFERLSESHTSQPALPFLRSQRATNSWINTAGAVLDTLAIIDSSLDLPADPQIAVTLRAGFLALDDIAEFYGAPVRRDPSPNDPISIRRDEFDERIAALAAGGLPIRSDLEAAWRSFAGWRVNYDLALLALCELCDAPFAPWSSDRSADVFRAPTLLHMHRWTYLGLTSPSSW